MTALTGKWAFFLLKCTNKGFYQGQGWSLLWLDSACVCEYSFCN